MRKISTKEAARRFFSVLKDAENAPIIIERHGRPRAAIVSARRFGLYEKLIAYYADELSDGLLVEALEKISEGRLVTGAKLRNEAMRFAKIAARSERAANGKEGAP